MPNIYIVAANIGARSIRHFKFVNVWPTLLRFRTTNRNCHCERKQVVHYLCYDVSIKLVISFDTTVLYIGEMLKCVWSVESIYVCFFSLLKRVLVGIWASEDKKNNEKKKAIESDRWLHEKGLDKERLVSIHLALAENGFLAARFVRHEQYRKRLFLLWRSASLW